ATQIHAARSTGQDQGRRFSGSQVSRSRGLHPGRLRFPLQCFACRKCHRQFRQSRSACSGQNCLPTRLEYRRCPIAVSWAFGHSYGYRALNQEPGWMTEQGHADPPGAVNPWLVTLTVSMATFMEVMDTSIANVALRHIAASVGADQSESTWVLTSYLISNAIV